jgi:hypothetical protein
VVVVIRSYVTHLDAPQQAALRHKTKALCVMELNWDAIGAVAESLGALGVIASLIYLGIQLKSNASASRVESKIATLKMLTEFNDKFIHYPELYDLWTRGKSGTETLTDEEYAQFFHLNMNSFWVVSAGYYQNVAGKLSDGDWVEVASILDTWMENEGIQKWWSRHAGTKFNPNFVSYVNARYGIETDA